MDYRHIDVSSGHPCASAQPKKPETFDEMRALAENLSVKIPHLRGYFYEVNEKPYFGEMTFSHWSGFVPFEPEEWDETFGSWIKLPQSFGGDMY